LRAQRPFGALKIFDPRKSDQRLATILPALLSVACGESIGLNARVRLPQRAPAQLQGKFLDLTFFGINVFGPAVR
jgi:hypothetical protein